MSGDAAALASDPPRPRASRGVLPGFPLALGYTLLYLSLIVLLPLSATFFKAAGLGWEAFWSAVTAPRALASYALTFGASFVAALVNVALGLLLAWVLVRYRFPGKKLVDALIDLPFALPTAVAGITLATLYAPSGWVGRLFAAWDWKIAYARPGIVLALVFIGLPFVVRTVQPVLQEIDREYEEAAASLGADRWNVFRRVLFPAIAPALLAGFTLAFARAIGEYGSVVFIAGNMPMVTEIAPLLIITKLEQYDYAGATAIAVTLLVVSFALLLAINALQAWGMRRMRA
jgi:sulfate transport system permease protein